MFDSGVHFIFIRMEVQLSAYLPRDSHLLFLIKTDKVCSKESMEFLHLEDETDDEEEPDFQADFSEGVGDSDSSSDGLHTD